ncbi:MAG: DUF2254 domain-containing protein [Candidatus Rokubacteria bacterium]|nr:DUF2254 domain-containing protein [Candidatus Rokubacteria bacterium]
MYCLLVLRTIRGDDGLADDAFIPHLAVTGGVALAILSAGVLIYFIHHAAVGIQADHVIAAIAREMDTVVDSLYPEQAAGDVEPPPSVRLPEGFAAEAEPAVARTAGYVQTIAVDDLVAFARAHDVIVRLEWSRPGSRSARWSARRSARSANAAPAVWR